MERTDVTETQLKYKPVNCGTYVDGIPIDLYSIIHRRLDIIEDLLNMGCTFSSVDENGCGALHLSAKEDTNMLYTIFTNTTSHHLFDKSNRTPLHHAVIHGRRNHYSLLREQLFDQDNNGDTPLHLAVRKGCIYSVQQLMELCPPTPYRFYAHYLKDEASVLSCIVANNKRETALTYAVTHAMLDIIKVLAYYPLLIDEKIDGKSAKDHTVVLARSKKDVALEILKLFNR